MDFKKWCPENVLTVIFTAGCIVGIYETFKTLTTSSMGLFERILEGVISPLAYGLVSCLAYFIVATIISFIVEHYIKEKTFSILVVIACIAIGLFFAFTITG